MIRPTFRIATYGSVVVAGLCLALVVQRAEPVVAVAPFALFLAVGALAGPPPRHDVRLRLEPTRIVEGDSATVTVTRGEGVDVVPQLPAAVPVADSHRDDRTDAFVLRPRRWGAFDVGTVAVRSADPLRLWLREDVLGSGLVLRVTPSAARLRRVVAPDQLAPFVGQHTSRARGDGFELAELRPYARGDRARAVNWRATARRGEPWVNDRRPERVGDVVLLLDTFGTEAVDRLAVLDRAVRTLAALADAYVRSHDRVGLLTFGGHIRWLRPGAGRRNLARIVDGMLDTERLLTETWEATMRVPVGVVAPRSLLVAVTTLDNDTTMLTLLDLRARGFDVAVLTLDGQPEGSGPARRLELLLRDARRRRLQRFGVAVADAEQGVAESVEEVRAWRRRLSRSSR